MKRHASSTMMVSFFWARRLRTLRTPMLVRWYRPAAAYTSVTTVAMSSADRITFRATEISLVAVSVLSIMMGLLKYVGWGLLHYGACFFCEEDQNLKPV